MSKYSTKTMLPAVAVMPHASTFLRDLFFPRTNDETFVTEKVELDYKKGKRKMAPFVAPRIGGITQTRDGFTTKEIAPPRIAPQTVLTVDDLSKRSFGENVYSQKTPAQRARETLAADLKDLGTQIDRREEWMVSKLLFEGKVIVKGYSDNNLTNFIEQEIDFGFTNTAVVSAADLWDANTSNPYEFLRESSISTLKLGGERPNVAIFGEDAYSAWMNNAKVQQLFEDNKILVGVIQPTLKDDHVTFIGKLPELNLELYLYNDWYLDESGVEQSYVPAKKIVMGRAGMGGFVYGAVTQLESEGYVTYEGDRVPKFWSDEANDIQMMRLASRPIPLPRNVDSWFVATVCS